MTATSGALTLADLAATANREHDAFELALVDAVTHAVRAGEALRSAKAALPHGSWGAWLRENFNGSERSAQAYMQVSRDPQRAADFASLRQALAALATPRAERPVDEDEPPAEPQADDYPPQEWPADAPQPPRGTPQDVRELRGLIRDVGAAAVMLAANVRQLAEAGTPQEVAGAERTLRNTSRLLVNAADTLAAGLE